MDREIERLKKHPNSEEAVKAIEEEQKKHKSQILFNKSKLGIS